MLVAVGLMSIVTLGVMTVWGNVTESQKSVAALQDISSFVKVIFRVKLCQLYQQPLRQLT